MPGMFAHAIVQSASVVHTLELSSCIMKPILVRAMGTKVNEVPRTLTRPVVPKNVVLIRPLESCHQAMHMITADERPNVSDLFRCSSLSHPT